MELYKPLVWNITRTNNENDGEWNWWKINFQKFDATKHLFLCSRFLRWLQQENSDISNWTTQRTPRAKQKKGKTIWFITLWHEWAKKGYKIPFHLLANIFCGSFAVDLNTKHNFFSISKQRRAWKFNYVDKSSRSFFAHFLLILLLPSNLH